MQLLALDLATVTGFAVGEPGGQPVSGAHRIAPPSTDTGSFLLRYRRWFVDMQQVHRPEVVVFEAPILPSTTTIDTARKLYALAAFTEYLCKATKTRCYEAHMQQVRKFFAGSGRAQKTDVMEACRRRGWTPADHNEADALAVFEYGCHKVAPETMRRHALAGMGATA